MALLSAMPLVPVPAKGREQVLANLTLISSRPSRRRRRPGSRRQAKGWTKDGFPPGIDDRRARPHGLVAAAAIAALVVAALLVAPTNHGHDSNLALGFQATTTRPAPIAPAGASAEGTGPVRPGIGAPLIIDGGDGPSRPGRPSRIDQVAGAGAGSAGTLDAVTPAAPPALPAPPNPADPIDPTSPTDPRRPDPVDNVAPTISASASSAACAADLVASVTDQASISSVIATWKKPDGSGDNAAMALRSGGTYGVTTGPYPPGGGAITWSVTATDASGNRARVAGPAITLVGCGAVGGP